MSYYVLTAASNLGNILSSETISPAALYARRNYGYRFFDRHGDDVAENHIRLHHAVPNPIVDGFGAASMVMELDERLVRHVAGAPDGGLWTCETIRLTPDRCKFVFFTDEDLNAAFNGVQRNLEAKFADRYRSKARVVTPTSNEKIPFDEVGQANPSIDDSQIEDIGRFERMDRIKGAIFGYCLGFYYSLPRDSSVRDDFARYLVTLDDMVNSVTQTPAENLEGYRVALERILFRFILHGEAKGLERTGADIDAAFNLEDELKRIGKLACVEPPLDVLNDSLGLSIYRSDLEGRIRKAKDAWKRPTPFRLDNRPRVVESPSGPIIQLPEKDGELASHLVNRLIRMDVLGRTNRKLGYPFALECGKETKRFFGESWEDCGERAYINRLLPHLNSMDAFDVDDRVGIEDERSHATLKAIALICEKQDNEDLESYYRYLLIKCRVADFWLPFALWGATFGFSAMPKTLCDSMSKPTEDAARALFADVLTMIEDQNG